MNKIKNHFFKYLYLLLGIQFFWELLISDVLSLSRFPILFIITYFLLTIFIFSLCGIYLKVVWKDTEKTIIIFGLLIWQMIRIVINISHSLIDIKSILGFLSLGMIIFIIIRKLRVSRKSIFASILFFILFLLLSAFSNINIIDSLHFGSVLLKIFLYSSTGMVIISLLLSNKFDIPSFLSYSVLSILVLSAYPVSRLYELGVNHILALLFWSTHLLVFYGVVPILVLKNRNSLIAQQITLGISALVNILISWLSFNYLQLSMYESNQIWSISIRVIMYALLLWFPFFFLYLNNHEIHFPEYYEQEKIK